MTSFNHVADSFVDICQMIEIRLLIIILFSWNDLSNIYVTYIFIFIVMWRNVKKTYFLFTLFPYLKQWFHFSKCSCIIFIHRPINTVLTYSILTELATKCKLIGAKHWKKWTPTKSIYNIMSQRHILPFGADQRHSNWHHATGIILRYACGIICLYFLFVQS